MQAESASGEWPEMQKRKEDVEQSASPLLGKEHTPGEDESSDSLKMLSSSLTSQCKIHIDCSSESFDTPLVDLHQAAKELDRSETAPSGTDSSLTSDDTPSSSSSTHCRIRIDSCPPSVRAAAQELARNGTTARKQLDANAPPYVFDKRAAELVKAKTNEEEEDTCHMDVDDHLADHFDAGIRPSAFHKYSSKMNDRFNSTYRYRLPNEVIIQTREPSSFRPREPSSIHPSQPPFGMPIFNGREERSLSTPSARGPRTYGRRRPFTGREWLGTESVCPGDIIRFDFPLGMAGAALPMSARASEVISYYGIAIGDGLVLHCFNLSDPASAAVPWVLFDFRVWCENILWTAHAVVLCHRICELCSKGAIRVRVCNNFDSTHRPLPVELITDRAWSRLNIAFPDYLNPGFWSSLSFACWCRYCVTHPNPMAATKNRASNTRRALSSRRPPSHAQKGSQIHSEYPGQLGTQGGDEKDEGKVENHQTDHQEASAR